MNAEEQLEAARGIWEQLAQHEGEAIRSRDWAALTACQQSIEQLQSEVTSLLGQVREFWSQFPAGAPREKQIRQGFSNIIELERSNAALLEIAARQNRSELSQLQTATQSMQRLRASYAPALPSAWNSFC